MEAIAKPISNTPKMEAFKTGTLESFYAWAKGIGHYHATEAVERYRKVIKEMEDVGTGT